MIEAPGTGYTSGVKRRPGTARIVMYRCELCATTYSRDPADHPDGMCPSCGWPMRIDDVVRDRRIISLPVRVDRRAA
jgi:rRNA maturation endonuclease Nob1